MIQTKHVLILLLFLSFGCKSDHVNDSKSESSSVSSLITKLYDSDRFKHTIIESSYYKLDPRIDNTIKTDKGNLLIVPSGSLLDENGQIVEDSIQIEFAEGTDIDEIILSNLTIQDSARIFESYLSFFLNATRNGKQLVINPDNPIYFELPADKQVSLYKGIRDKIGNMTWKKDKNSVDYLIPVSLDLLDFYPEGFELEVEKGLPYRDQEFLTKKLLDSLYYSFATELDESGYYNWNSRFLMINTLKPVLSLLAQEEFLSDEIHIDTVAAVSEESFCGINPASIKAIRNKKFQNTLISTREFEYRIKTIFATCDNNILELYINNLNKDLWEIDEMAAKQLGNSNNEYQKFIEFASYKQTTVKLSDRKAELLAENYKRNKEKIEQDLQKIKKKYIKEKKKLEQIAQEKKEEYKELLKARRIFRMKKFGFELTDFGWYNAAREIKLIEVETFNLNITIDGGNQYDRVYSYVINPKIRSIFSYTSFDKTNFNIVYSEDPNLLLWKNQEFNVIGVGYRADTIGYKIIECVQKPTVNVDLTLVDGEYKSFKKDIGEFSRWYKHENNILVDLEYQAFFYSEQKRKEREWKEKVFIDELRKKVFPCCDWPEIKDEDIEMEFVPL